MPRVSLLLVCLPALVADPIAIHRTTPTDTGFAVSLGVVRGAIPREKIDKV